MLNVYKKKLPIKLPAPKSKYADWNKFTILTKTASN
jgi:hypothetical protein